MLSLRRTSFQLATMRHVCNKSTHYVIAESRSQFINLSVRMRLWPRLLRIYGRQSTYASDANPARVFTAILGNNGFFRFAFSFVSQFTSRILEKGNFASWTFTHKWGFASSCWQRYSEHATVENSVMYSPFLDKTKRHSCEKVCSWLFHSAQPFNPHFNPHSPTRAKMKLNTICKYKADGIYTQQTFTTFAT